MGLMGASWGCRGSAGAVLGLMREAVQVELRREAKAHEKERQGLQQEVPGGLGIGSQGGPRGPVRCRPVSRCCCPCCSPRVVPCACPCVPVPVCLCLYACACGHVGGQHARDHRAAHRGASGFQHQVATSMPALLKPCSPQAYLPSYSQRPCPFLNHASLLHPSCIPPASLLHPSCLPPFPMPPSLPHASPLCHVCSGCQVFRAGAQGGLGYRQERGAVGGHGLKAAGQGRAGRGTIRVA